MLGIFGALILHFNEMKKSSESLHAENKSLKTREAKLVGGELYAKEIRRLNFSDHMN